MLCARLDTSNIFRGIIVRNPDGSVLGLYADVPDPNMAGEVGLAKAKYISSTDLGKFRKEITFGDLKIPVYHIK